VQRPTRTTRPVERSSTKESHDRGFYRARIRAATTIRREAVRRGCAR
jgi:hypothetical protein